MEFEPSTSSITSSQPCRHFEFPEILTATENFDESLVIGSGGFGKVYKGNIINGSSLVVAAIKRLDSMSKQGATEFWVEVEMVSMLRHCNLVSLIGYCNYEKDMILVYEYMPNGTLDDHLHKLRSPLSWFQRLNICIGAGRGLHYLHTGTGIQSGVIHRDVKSSNILLNESWAAKISDFGLSKIGPTNQPTTYVNTLIKGTFGYLDPVYFTTGRLTRKSDVYAFGVVLLEVLCRKRAVDTSLDDEQYGLVTWVQDSIKEGNLKHVIDSDIRSEISPKCLKKFVKIAERCLQNSPKQRPTMAEVVVSLESVLALQEKINNSMQSRGKTLFCRMVNMLPFPSNEEYSVQSNSSNNKKCDKGIDSDTSVFDDNYSFRAMQEDPADFQSPSPCVKKIILADLEKAIRKFCPDLLLGEGSLEKVFLSWVDQNSSKHGEKIAVAVERLRQEGHLEVARWLESGFAKYDPESEAGETHVSRQDLGTEDCVTSEYRMNGRLKKNDDIYNIALVLLKSMTGRMSTTYNRHKGKHCKLVDLATTILSKRNSVKEILDDRLETQLPPTRGLAKILKDRRSREEVLQSFTSNGRNNRAT